MAFYQLVLLIAFHQFCLIQSYCNDVRYSCKQYELRISYIKERKGYLTELYCSCDTVCKFFQDCCEDALANEEQLPNSFNELSLDHLSCVLFPEVSIHNYLYYVDRCPSSWPGEMVRKACENNNTNSDDFMLRIPVTGNKTGLIYKNMYCAICHRSMYLFWVPVVSCEHDDLSITGNTTLYDVYQVPGCFLKYEKPASNIDYRHCLTPRPIVDTCNKTYVDTDNITERCEEVNYLRTVFNEYDTMVAYRNIYCALCNNAFWTCYPYTLHDSVKQYEQKPFSIKIDINKAFGIITRGTKYARETKYLAGIHKCATDQIFNPFTMTCVGLLCDDWMVPKDGICQPYNDTASPDCPRITLDQTEYTILDNGDLLELSSGLHYSKSLYYINNSLAFVCINFVGNHTENRLNQNRIIVFKFSLSEVIVSITGLSISLLGLFITIITYFVIISLQNTAGKCLLSLVCALFIGNLLILVGSNAEYFLAACKGIAICMHYFLLAAFFWMNTVAAEVLLTIFKIVDENATAKFCHRFCLYCIYSLSAPALIVVTSLFVDTLSLDSTFKPNYGIGLCWLTNKNALLVFFAGPLFFTILINTILFVIVAIKMSQIRYSDRYTDAKAKINIFIYVKLFVVTGLTWTVGVVANIIPHPAVWYLFTVLNAVQGMFIFITFVTTKKVWMSVRGRLFALDGELQNDDTIAKSSLETSSKQE